MARTNIWRNGWNLNVNTVSVFHDAMLQNQNRVSNNEFLPITKLKTQKVLGG